MTNIQYIIGQREMAPSPQCNNEIYDEFYEVPERKEICTRSASGGEGNTASISSFYVTPLREQQATSKLILLV